MKVFVTGGTGFIGSHFLNKAISAGNDVRALRRAGSKTRIILDENPNWLEGDLESVQVCDLEGCDVLVHLASYGVNPKDSDWGEIYRWNVAESLSVWRKAIEAGVKRLIICGSCFEYGLSGEELKFLTTDSALKPVTPYAASKAAASMLAMGLGATEGVEVVVVRPFHVYGEGESESRLWPSLRKAALAGEDFKMTRGAQVRDFTPVELVVEKMMEMINKEVFINGSSVINIGSGKPMSILQFSQKWWSEWEAKGKLLVGALEYRENEVMRFVPKI